MRPSRAMFVRDFIDIPQPFEAVAPRLVRDPAWLNPIAHDALQDAVTAMGGLRPDQAVDVRLSQLDVRCTRGPVRLRVDTLVMPMRWDTNLPESVLPSLDGELEVLPLGADRSQLALNATTPRSASQRDAITRRVIETSLRVFLRRLAGSFDLVS
jgi:hypothetical protein